MTSAEARFNNSLRPRKPEGSLGRTAQDVHLDSHTAPELCDQGYETNGRHSLQTNAKEAELHSVRLCHCDVTKLRTLASTFCVKSVSAVLCRLRDFLYSVSCMWFFLLCGCRAIAWFIVVVIDRFLYAAILCTRVDSLSFMFSVQSTRSLTCVGDFFACVYTSVYSLIRRTIVESTQNLTPEKSRGGRRA